MSYIQLDEFLCCGSKDLELILDLTDQPLANSYKKNKTDNEERTQDAGQPVGSLGNPFRFPSN